MFTLFRLFDELDLPQYVFPVARLRVTDRYPPIDAPGLELETGGDKAHGPNGDSFGNLGVGHDDGVGSDRDMAVEPHVSLDRMAVGYLDLRNPSEIADEVGTRAPDAHPGREGT